MRLSAHPADSQRGAALILVLWVSAAAAALAVGFLGWARADANLNRNAEAEIRARLATESALAATAYRLMAGKLALKNGRAELTVSLDGVDVQAIVHGESGFIDLNKASKGLLEALAIATGVDRSAADAAAKAIVAWRDVPKSKSQGKLIQRKLFGDRLVSRTDHAFDYVNELRLVPDLDPGIVQRIAPWLTVYTRTGEVDSTVAPTIVRKALMASPGAPAATIGTSTTGTAAGGLGATTTPEIGASSASATVSAGTLGTLGSTSLGTTQSTGSAGSSSGSTGDLLGTSATSSSGSTGDLLGTSTTSKQATVAGSTDPKNLYRLTLVARTPAGLVTRHTVVIWLDGRADRPYRVLDWSPPELAGQEIG